MSRPPLSKQTPLPDQDDSRQRGRFSSVSGATSAISIRRGARLLAASHGMNGREVRGEQLLAHPLVILRSMALGEAARGGRELGGSEIRRRRIDPIARQRERLGRRARRSACLRSCGGSSTPRARRLARPIALEAIALHRRSPGTTAWLRRRRRLGPAESGAAAAARRIPLHATATRHPDVCPVRRRAMQAPPRGIRHQQHAMLLALEMVARRASARRARSGLRARPRLPPRTGARAEWQRALRRSCVHPSINPESRLPRRVFRSTSAAAAAAVLA